MDDSSSYIYIFLTLIFSAFFSGMEIAFLSANKLKIELDKKEGTISGKILSNFLKQPSRFIGTMLVGNNISLVIYGILMARLLEPVFFRVTNSEFIVLMCQTLVSTIIILVSAEFLPKRIFRLAPNHFLNWLCIPLFIIYHILWIPMILIIGLSEAVLKSILKVNFSENDVTFGRIDLDEYIKEISSDAERKGEKDSEIQIFQNALEFSKIKVRECMVPRTDIEAIDLEESVEELSKKFIETGLSKVLIYKESIDNIIGYVHSFELFKKPENIKSVLRPISIIPETMLVNEVLETFIKKQKNIAVVVDEFGGTSGMLTIEDVVEEIFGDIEDEHDIEDTVERSLADNTFEFSARLEIDYLNEKYKLDFPESDNYETLAGFIIDFSETIPEEKEVINIDKWSFEILKVLDNRIDLIKVKEKEQ